MLDVARLAQVQFSFALWVLLICVAALAVRNVFGRPPAPDLVLPARLRELELREPWRTRGRWALDGGLALAALVLAVLTIGAVKPSGVGLDHGRILHEQVQAKYHAELGWDGLYACVWAADHESERRLRKVQRLRALTVEPAPTLEPEPKPELRIDLSGKFPRKVPVPTQREPREPPPKDVGGKLWPSGTAVKEAKCHERFDDARWAAFSADVANVIAIAHGQPFGPVLGGFGSTASPGRLARQRLVFSLLPISGGGLFAVGLVNGLLLIGALVLLARAYGVRAAGLIGIVCFVEFARSPIMFGATVSEPLLIAVVLAAMAAWELERFAWAGGLLAFAAVDSVWPALLLLGLLAKLGLDWLNGNSRKRELTRFVLAAAGVGVGFLLLSATLPGGLGNWSVWANRVAVHRYADGSTQVGLQWLFVPDGSWLGGPAEVPYPEKAQRLVDRGDWISLCGLVLLVPSLLAARRLPAVAFAAIAGVTATFCMFSTDAASMSLGLPLLVIAAAAVAKHHEPSALLLGRPTTVLVAGTLALCVGMHGMVRIQPFAPWLFNMIYSYLFVTFLLGLGAALLLLPGLREHGDPPGAPASVPLLEPRSGRVGGLSLASLREILARGRKDAGKDGGAA